MVRRGAIEWAAVTIGVLVFIITPLLIRATTDEWLGVDWITYVNAADRLSSGGSLYSAVQLAGPYHPIDVVRTGFVYPPPAVVPFMAIGAIGWQAWSLGNAIVLATGLIAIARRHSVLLAAPLVMAILLATYYYAEGFQVANINVGFAGVLAWCWALGRTHRLAPILGALMGIAKVYPGSVVLWARPRRRAGGAAALVAAVVVVATLPVVGIDSWTDWLASARNVAPNCGYERPPIACYIGTPATFAATAALSIGAWIVAGELLSFTMIVLAMLIPQYELAGHSVLYLAVLGMAAACTWVESRRISSRLHRPHRRQRPIISPSARYVTTTMPAAKSPPELPPVV